MYYWAAFLCPLILDVKRIVGGRSTYFVDRRNGQWNVHRVVNAFIGRFRPIDRRKMSAIGSLKNSPNLNVLEDQLFHNVLDSFCRTFRNISERSASGYGNNLNKSYLSLPLLDYLERLEIPCINKQVVSRQLKFKICNIQTKLCDVSTSESPSKLERS